MIHGQANAWFPGGRSGFTQREDAKSMPDLLQLPCNNMLVLQIEMFKKKDTLSRCRPVFAHTKILFQLCSVAKPIVVIIDGTIVRISQHLNKMVSH